MSFIQIRYFKKEAEIATVLLEVPRSESHANVGFAPIDLDEYYRVIISEDPIGFEGEDVNLFRYVENNPVNWIDPFGSSKWYPVPGKKGWEVRRDKPHHPKDYYHDHYRHKGKEKPRKVDPKSGKQRPHGEGKCNGEDTDIPQDVVDAANKGFKFTGDIGFDLGVLEGLEALNDLIDDIEQVLPEAPLLPIPGYIPVPIPVFVP